MSVCLRVFSTLAIFILLCLNVVIAPVVYSVADSTLERSCAWVKKLKIKNKILAAIGKLFMAIIRETIRAIFITLMLWLLTAIIYPLIILVVGQVFLPYQANGSIMRNLNNQPIGSALIGQVFTSERYFHPRPSTVRYSQGKKAKPTGISGASNLAASNPELLKRILEQANQLRDENLQPIADIIYTSASGLDPHISLKAARQQLTRVAGARGVKEDEILRLINKYSDGRFLWIFGEPGVNVLRLNYALDLQDFNRQQNQ